MKKDKILIALIAIISCNSYHLSGTTTFITTESGGTHIVLYDAVNKAEILLFPDTEKGVERAVANLRTDYQKVTGHLPTLRNSFAPTKMPLFIIGTLGTHSAIDALVEQKKTERFNVKRKA